MTVSGSIDWNPERRPQASRRETYPSAAVTFLNLLTAGGARCVYVCVRECVRVYVCALSLFQLLLLTGVTWYLCLGVMLISVCCVPSLKLLKVCNYK